MTYDTLLTWRQFERQQITERTPIRLPDYWWFLRRHHFGRSGHSYVCPFLITCIMQLLRLRGYRAYWIVESPDWFYEDSDLYCSAHAQSVSPQGSRVGIVPPRWSLFLIKLEMRLESLHAQVSYWLFHVFGLRPLSRKPLGKPIYLPPANYDDL